METLTVQNRPLASLSSGQAAHLYITIGFATTPPTPTESEAGLRGRPAAEAPNKKKSRRVDSTKIIPVKMYKGRDFDMLLCKMISA